MRAKVYIDSSIPSFLTAKPSRDLHNFAKQMITREWWDDYRNHFDVFVSAAVIQEISAGDANAVKLRQKVIQDIPVLGSSLNIEIIANDLLKQLSLPATMVYDATHVAIALENGMNYLVTWNLKHLANAVIKRRISFYCAKKDYVPLTICTPEELMEAWNAER